MPTADGHAFGARRAVDEYFAEYAQSHRTLGNEVTHVIGIPVIVFSL